MPRLFIGIELPRAYQDGIRPFSADLGRRLNAKIKWTQPGNWHLTLKFLGDTDTERIPFITEALAAIDAPKFVMRAGGAGVFPNLKRPRVLWLGLAKGAQSCATLAEAIQNALHPLGIERDDRTFRPHLTLGRIKKPGRNDWSAILDAADTHSWQHFTVDRFILWESVLKPTGAVHIPLEQFLLDAKSKE